MATPGGIGASSVQRIWRAHGVVPHRMRHFRLSNDPDFVPKFRNAVGLYVDPRPFVWASTPDKIVAAVKHGREVLVGPPGFAFCSDAPPQAIWFG